MGEPDLVIDCEALTRSFPSGIALDALTLDVKRGEVLALLGPNGAGKTTTMRLLNGVLLADSGQARVLGLDPWAQGEELRRRTGVLTENAGLDERFTALENASADRCETRAAFCCPSPARSHVWVCERERGRFLPTAPAPIKPLTPLSPLPLTRHW